MTTKNLDKFRTAMCAIDWSKEIGELTCPTAITQCLHDIVNKATDECLPWRDGKVRSTDDPWITDEIRRAIRRRRRRYNKWHRAKKWKDVKIETDTLIKEAKRAFYNGAVNKLKEIGSSQLPYKVLKELAIPDRPAPWSINATRPGLDDLNLAEELADYFVKITDEFTPLEPGRHPITYDSTFELLLPHQVASAIRAERKPKSAVSGDILPCLANQYSDLIAVPATRIINFSLARHEWPAPWRVETQTAIPKGENASSFDNFRNLSCTNALAKLLESYVLEKLQKEVRVKPNQFGGTPDSGTAHFLIECWDRILRGINVPDAAVALLSVDFSKAFNRMDLRACMDALHEGGASTDSLAMISSFLTGRTMRFKMGSQLSSSRLVKGGSPQGTKFNNFLFIVTINRIVDKLRDSIESQESLVLLGFRFVRRPNVSGQLSLIQEKFNARSWMIHHLKQAGVPDKDVLTIYTSMIWPVIEYACQVYSPMLTATQSDDLEKL